MFKKAYQAHHCAPVSDAGLPVSDVPSATPIADTRHQYSVARSNLECRNRSRGPRTPDTSAAEQSWYAGALPEHSGLRVRVNLRRSTRVESTAVRLLFLISEAKTKVKSLGSPSHKGTVHVRIREAQVHPSPVCSIRGVLVATCFQQVSTNTSKSVECAVNG